MPVGRNAGISVDRPRRGYAQERTGRAGTSPCGTPLGVVGDRPCARLGRAWRRRARTLGQRRHLLARRLTLGGAPPRAGRGRPRQAREQRHARLVGRVRRHFGLACWRSAFWACGGNSSMRGMRRRPFRLRRDEHFRHRGLALAAGRLRRRRLEQRRFCGIGRIVTFRAPRPRQSRRSRPRTARTAPLCQLRRTCAVDLPCMRWVSARSRCQLLDARPGCSPRRSPGRVSVRAATTSSTPTPPPTPE